MLEFLETIVRGRKKKHKDFREEKLTEIEEKIDEFERSLNDKNAKKKAKEFYSLVKKSFREMLGFRYSATFQEIAGEIEKRKEYNETVTREAQDFLQEISLMEYGTADFRDFVKEEEHEREKALRKYIKDLEKEHEHIKKETKKRIYNIVSKIVPRNEKEAILETSRRFRTILRKL